MKLVLYVMNQNRSKMKAVKLLFGFMIVGMLTSSCYTEVILNDDFINTSAYNTARVLETYDLWYVDIHATRGNGEVPFVQRAFTLSFRNGILYANNNIVGIGDTGNGLGIQVGFYDTLQGAVEIDHDIDGLWLLDVYAVNGNTIELYEPRTDTSYYLEGYQRNTFDYDQVFYENIHYFLQEYEAWEKTFTSVEGALNEFDDENFLQFFSGGSSDTFRSSVDGTGTPISQLVWDYEGNYTVYDVPGDESLKTLTLDYDYLGDDYFELYVIDDGTIELYHPDSGTIYEFGGQGYLQFLKSKSGKGTQARKRVKRTLPKMHVKRQRK